MAAPEIALQEIGAAIQRDPNQAGPSKVPRLSRMKMPDYLVNIPKPTPKPVVEERPAPVAAAAPAGAEGAADRAGAGRPGERGAPVDDRGGRGRKVIYDRRRDSSATADGGRARGKKRGKQAKMTAVPSPLMSQQKRNLKIEDTITVANLAHQMAVKGNEVIRKLFDLGIMATVNHPLDLETAELIAQEFGYTVENVGFDLESYLQQPTEARPTNEQPRPPVVTVMGHVDHGKTSLLDAIRKTHTASREAGGITQHIGAYAAEVAGKGKVVFLDTPGHEAFTAMRARGAKATDVIVLVVAADDGVMPQTIEAINHGKAAKVPIIVAVNKIDKPGADLEKVRRELAEQGIMAEEWGGDAIFCEVSAKTGKGIDKLLEMLVLQSEVLDLKADPDADARGLVIESRLERGRGPVATLLVQTGTLKKGQFVVSGAQYAKVRAMQDDAGKPIETAGPSTPVEVIGFDTVTSAGDEFYVVADEKKAKAIVEHRVEKTREKEALKTSKRTLEEMFATSGADAQRELNLIVKADVHGSAEALKQALSKIEHEEVKVRVLHAAVGGVTESDIQLASASKAVIIAFNVKPEAKGKRLADDLNVPIKNYSVIYDAIDEVTSLLEGMLTPIIEEHILGHAEVRELFSVPKLGTIAGCSVLDGVINRNQRMRLFRGKEQVWEGEIASLKRFKDDVREVAIGYECGIGLQGFNKLIIGDRLECFELKKIARKLKPDGNQGGSRPSASPA
jgi:translation initiation factor IF-2